MVGVEFKGRFGNQLFQFFFLLYLKSNNKEKTFFFVNPHHSTLTKYFDLGWRNNLILGSKIYSIFTRCLPILCKFKTIHIPNINCPKKIEVRNNSVYTGFFQSEWYLKNTSDKFKIRIKEKYVKSFNQQYGGIFKNEKTIVVHIRRTDYLKYGKRDISLPIEYFKSQLESIENLKSYKVFFVSDDIDFVKSYFGLKTNFVFSSNDDIIDFQLIKNADIAIISNSSFGWWAAYLSEKKNTVIAPKNWMAFRLGKEHPKGIMTSRFIWMDVLSQNDIVKKV